MAPICDRDSERQLQLRPASLFESGDSTGKISLKKLFGEGIGTTIDRSRRLDELACLIVRGGLPDTVGKSAEEASTILKDMIARFCEIDSRRTDGRNKNVYKFRKTLESLARNESAVAPITRIASDIRRFDNVSVEEETISEYLDVLMELRIIENQPAFSLNYRSPVRIGKKPKRHFTDPSLAIAAMDLNSESLKRDLNTFGFMFEALCERDLRIYAQTLGGKLYHYRDHSGREIDAVVEIPGGEWGAFEIKLGSNQTDDASQNLKNIARFIENDGNAKPPRFLCVISGTEDFAYRRPDGVYVVPICILGP